MRPPGSPAQLEKRRRSAVQLLRGGRTLSAVARQVHASVSSVFRWWQAYQREGPCLRLRRGSGVRRWGLEGRRRGHTRWGSAGRGPDVTSRLTDPVKAAKTGMLTDRGANGLLFSASTSNNLHSLWDKCLPGVVSGRARRDPTASRPWRPTSAA
jgi:hypothetical protein